MHAGWVPRCARYIVCSLDWLEIVKICMRQTMPSTAAKGYLGYRSRYIQMATGFPCLNKRSTSLFLERYIEICASTPRRNVGVPQKALKLTVGPLDRDVSVLHHPIVDLVDLVVQTQLHPHPIGVLVPSNRREVARPHGLALYRPRHGHLQ